MKYYFFIFAIICSVFWYQPQTLFTDSQRADISVNVSVEGCGDGQIDVGEACDTTNYNNNSCSDFGFSTGNLSCTNSCTIDTSGCSNSTGGGGGCSGDCTDPVISKIQFSAATTSATSTWTVMDAGGIANCTVQFSTGGGANQSASVTLVGNNGAAQFTGLTPETTYSVSITCTDTSANSRTEMASFTTGAVSSDTTGPSIDITSSSTTATSCLFDWNASDSAGIAGCAVRYSTDNSYGESAVISGTFTSTLQPLLPSTSYNVQIQCTDTNGNASTLQTLCTTNADTTPPAAVAGLSVSPGDKKNQLNWNYSTSISDFASFVMRRSTIACPFTVSDGTGIATITNSSARDYLNTGLTNGQQYFYSLFVVDTSGNSSAPVCAAGTPQGAIIDAEICTDGIDNDTDGAVDCADSDCTGNAACIVVLPPDGGQSEICTDGIDNDSDGNIDCADTDCSTHAQCTSTTDSVELICNDTIDNDGDGAIDCVDTDCVASLVCTAPKSACADGIDNDSDGLIDLTDPGCSSETDTDEYNEIHTDIAPTDAVTADQVYVQIAERTITQFDITAPVSTLDGDQISVHVFPRVGKKTQPIIAATLYIGTQTIPLQKSTKTSGAWYVDVIAPPVGSYTPAIAFVYDSGAVSDITFELQTLPYGRIISKDLAVPEAEVRLYADSGEFFAANTYRQSNPYTTGENGRYGFVVPNGRYWLEIKKNGYETRKTPVFTVNNNVINRSEQLIAIKIIEESTISSTTSSTAVNTLTYTKEKVTEQVRDTIEKITQVTQNPEVQEAARRVTPVAVGAAAAALIPSFWGIFLPLLRFVFLQPLLLFGKKRRQQYGVVYNSLTRKPLDLATLRLVDANSKKIIESQVTNKDGQYTFLPDIGQYMIEVQKNGYTSPSTVVTAKKTDGPFVDIYHGEVIQVTEDEAAATPNIPLDPITSDYPAWKLRIRNINTLVQHTLAIAGIIITLGTAIISPTPYIWILLALHVILYSTFIYYITPKKPQGWGMVAETVKGKALPHVIVRLFSKEYNKLISSQLTDRRGRYAFLVGPNEYYVTYEKPGYGKQQQDITVTNTKVLSSNVSLSPEKLVAEEQAEKGTKD